MFGALLKKQLMEVNVWLIQNRKTGKKRSAGTILMLAFVYVILFGFLGTIFWGLGIMLCEPLAEAGLAWLYLTLMALLAVVLGVFGSVFTTYSSLYLAKDNEMLLAMPIRPGYILAARLMGVWLWSAIYEMIVFIPALLVYWVYVSAAPAAVICGVVLLLLLSVFILTLSCILGYGVAKISVKMKHKSMVTVFVSLIFLCAYYYVYFKATELLGNFLTYAVTLGEKIQGSVKVLYWLGRAGEGDLLSLLLTAGIILVLFAAIYVLMSRSFLKLATTSQGVKKKEYRKKGLKAKSASGALLFKERIRFTSSANYMLNCSLGSLFLLIGGVFILIKSELITQVIGEMAPLQEMIPMIVCAALCFMVSMNDITAPSVSLEGKNLWIIQSLPVDPWEVLKAKMKLHLLLTLVPLLFCSGCMIAVMRPAAADGLFILLIPVLYTMLLAAFGLAVNLKTPNLNWTNEVVPIKQSFGVVMSMFGGWGVVAALGGLYYLLYSRITPTVYLILCAILIAAMTAGLLFWLKRRGSSIFSSL